MTTTDWRGRLDEKSDDDTPIDEKLSRRREARSLLIALLRPFQVTVALLAIVVVVENIARLTVPLLVQRGIDHGIPPIAAGGPAHELMVIVGALCAVVVVQAVSRMFFLRRSGQIGQKVLLELRRKVFRHLGGSTSRSMTGTRRAGWSAAPPMTSRPSRRCWRPASTA